MIGIPDSIRRVVYGVPADSAERAQIVRDEILAALQEESYTWAEIRASAKAAHEDLQADALPEARDEVQAVIRETCERYAAKGYEMEDLMKGVDSVQARASAKLR